MREIGELTLTSCQILETQPIPQSQTWPARTVFCSEYLLLWGRKCLVQEKAFNLRVNWFLRKDITTHRRSCICSSLALIAGRFLNRACLLRWKPTKLARDMNQGQSGMSGMLMLQDVGL